MCPFPGLQNATANVTANATSPGDFVGLVESMSPAEEMAPVRPTLQFDMFVDVFFMVLPDPRWQENTEQRVGGIPSIDNQLTMIFG